MSDANIFTQVIGKRGVNCTSLIILLHLNGSPITFQIKVTTFQKLHFNVFWSWKVAWILSKTFEYLQEIILISTKYLASKNFPKCKVQGFFITFSYNAGIRYIHLHHQDYKIDSITFQMDIGYSLCTFLLTSYQYDSGLNA